MSQDTQLMSGMSSTDFLSLYSETDVSYRIRWDCGGAVAQERQRKNGEGKVVDVDGKRMYQRTINHEAFADIASADPNAIVEEIA